MHTCAGVFAPGPAEQTDEDRIDKLSMSFPQTFGPRDRYSRPSTPASDYHRATASPNKIDIIVRNALADTARAQEQLALEVGKQTDAQASSKPFQAFYKMAWLIR